MAHRKSTHCQDCGEDLDINPVYKNRIYRQSRCRNCFNKRFNGRYKEQVREFCLKQDYGITIEDYNSLLNLQDGVCAICKQESLDKNLAVDHDHTTGEIRGLLCQKCNQAIGLLKESPDLIMNAYEYLEKTKWSKGLELVRIGRKA